MNSKGKVPDAWDDEDWDAKGNEPVAPNPPPEPEKLTKQQRRARQLALNKKLWDEAEAPDAPYFVQSRNDVPLQSDLKPAVKLLSRKPAPTVIAKKDSVSGVERLAIEDDDEDDDDSSKPRPLTLEERQAKAQKEREEKQRKYEEVRERLFGSSNPPSGSNTPGSVTPPRSGRGRGRGSKDSRPSSSNGSKGKQLYDPNYSTKPGQRQPDTNSKSEEIHVIRQPKAPDGSGRGGFGFASRKKPEV